MDSEEALTKLVNETIGLSEVVEHIRGLIEVVIQRVDKGLGGGKAGAVKAAPTAAPASDVVGQVSSFATKLSVATASVLAFIALPPLMTAAALQFVQALNPGLAEQFNRVLANLQATIGYGLEPIIDDAIATLRTWTATLMPAMVALRPVLDDLARTVGEVLITAIGQLVLIFRLALAVFNPLLRVVTTLVRWMMQVVDVINVAIGAFFDWVGALLEGLGYFTALDAVLNGFKNALNAVTIGLTYLSLAVLKMLGATSAVTAFREALQKRLTERKIGGGLVAAPKDVSTGGIEDISRKLTERAFQAQSGGGGARSDNELLEELLKVASTVEDTDLGAIIKRAVRDALREAREGVADVASGFYDKVKDVSSAPFRVLKRFASPLREEE